MENLNVSTRHRCSFHSRQIRATDANEIPRCSASSRADQWVTPNPAGGATGAPVVTNVSVATVAEPSKPSCVPLEPAVDTVAVAAAASEHPVAELARQLGREGRWAALAHVLDFDDLHMESTTHVSAVCVPAALAAGWDRAAGGPPPPLPQEIVDRTRARYVEAYELLTGTTF